MLTAVDHLIVSLRDKHRESASTQHRCPSTSAADLTSFAQITAHPKTPVIASIESPEALMNIAHIAGWRGRGMELVGLLVSAIIRKWALIFVDS
jgi:hypothetical protein